jgi:hypothetical protein
MIVVAVLVLTCSQPTPSPWRGWGGAGGGGVRVSVCKCAHAWKREWASWPTSQLKGQKTVGLLCWEPSPPGFYFHGHLVINASGNSNTRKTAVLVVFLAAHKGWLAFAQVFCSHTLWNSPAPPQGSCLVCTSQTYLSLRLQVWLCVLSKVGNFTHGFIL